MSPLDALGGQGAQRAQVLGQAHGGHDLGQLAGGLHAQDLEGQPRARVDARRPADGAHGQGEFQGANQVAALIL